MKFFAFSFLAVFAVWAVGVVNIDIATKKIPNARVVLGAKLLLLALGLLMLNSYLGSAGYAASLINGLAGH